MKRYLYMALESFAFIWLSILAADLLYLYAGGGWRESITIIRITELIWYILLVPFGIWLAVRRLKTKEQNEQSNTMG